MCSISESWSCLVQVAAGPHLHGPHWQSSQAQAGLLALHGFSAEHLAAMHSAAHAAVGGGQT